MEYLMRGVKAIVKSIGQHGVLSLFKKWILFINKFFTKKTEVSCFFLFIKIFDFKISALIFATPVIMMNSISFLDFTRYLYLSESFFVRIFCIFFQQYNDNKLTFKFYFPVLANKIFKQM